MTLIPLIGLFSGLLAALATAHMLPLAEGTVVRQLQAAHQPVEVDTTGHGWRTLLIPIESSVRRFAPRSWLHTARADLYWAQVAGQWTGWDEVQFWSLRIAAVGLGLLLGAFLFRGTVPALLAAFVGLQWPALRLHGIARRTRRRFLAELPEFIQLVAAGVATNLPATTAVERAADGQSIVAHWFRRVVRNSSMKALLARKGGPDRGYLRDQAEKSLLPELIGLAIQLDFIQQKGTHACQLLTQLADSVAAQYLSGVEQRAERIGAELVMPMIGFYFLPFLLVILTVLGYPILAGI